MAPGTGADDFAVDTAKAGRVAVGVDDQITKPQVPENGKAITADWMRRALSFSGAVDPPQIRSLVVEDIGAESRTLSKLLRCTMTYVDGAAQTPESVVVKLSVQQEKPSHCEKRCHCTSGSMPCFRYLAPNCVERRYGIVDPRAEEDRTTEALHRTRTHD